MTILKLISVLEMAEPALCVIAIVSILRSGAIKPYRYLVALLTLKTAFLVYAWIWLSFAHRVFTWQYVYNVYFYSYWLVFATESILMLAVTCSMYRLAMAPLKGLHSLGMLVFKWVASISILAAMGTAFTPHISGSKYLIAFVSQLQRSQSILILCLLVFVCFAIRPMGLTYRSRIFGVSLGLGLMATTSMIQSTWLTALSNMYGFFSVINSIAVCITLATWTVYFALPEPRRRIITLPTTSPFLRWNQISEILGDDPGHVAIAGLPPEMLAPAEIEIMRRASMKMKTAWTTPSQSIDAA